MDWNDPLMLVLRGISFVAGTSLVVYTVLSGIRIFVLPRPARVLIFRLVFLNIRRLFDVFALRTRSYEARDRAMAMYAPIALFFIPVVLMTLVMVGFMAIYWALSPLTVIESFKLSGSSLLTLAASPTMTRC